MNLTFSAVYEHLVDPVYIILCLIVSKAFYGLTTVVTKLSQMCMASFGIGTIGKPVTQFFVCAITLRDNTRSSFFGPVELLL